MHEFGKQRILETRVIVLGINGQYFKCPSQLGQSSVLSIDNNEFLGEINDSLYSLFKGSFMCKQTRGGGFYEFPLPLEQKRVKSFEIKRTCI